MPCLFETQQLPKTFDVLSRFLAKSHQASLALAFLVVDEKVVGCVALEPVSVIQLPNWVLHNANRILGKLADHQAVLETMVATLRHVELFPGRSKEALPV